MTCVERVIEYSSAESETAGGKEMNNWPKKGRVEFKDVILKYPINSHVILKNLNFVIEPKEKIGIIGRTGAGKSSIISILFRLYEVSGKIIIDDCDIKTLKLDYLRSRLSIIPQDPVLFNGTLRQNLDPNDEYSDEQIWKALESVKIRELVEDLNSKIEERGANYSIGQRQLICLGRALMRQNKILILDEATANVDPQTNSLIQKAIVEKFSNCTVLTIAHHLDTIINSDKILVLDSGSLIEFDSPKNLLNNENSRFYSMAKQAGLVK